MRPIFKSGLYLVDLESSGLFHEGGPSLQSRRTRLSHSEPRDVARGRKCVTAGIQFRPPQFRPHPLRPPITASASYCEAHELPRPHTARALAARHRGSEGSWARTRSRSAHRRTMITASTRSLHLRSRVSAMMVRFRPFVLSDARLDDNHRHRAQPNRRAATRTAAPCESSNSAAAVMAPTAPHSARG